MPRQTARVVVVRQTESGEKQLLVMERYRRDAETGILLHYYSIPGGHIEVGETAEQAAVREVDEEMGISIQLGDPFAVVHERDGSKHFYFMALYISGEPHLSINSPEARYFSPDNQFYPRWILLNEDSLQGLHGVYQKLVPRILDLSKGKKHQEPWRISEISL